MNLFWTYCVHESKQEEEERMEKNHQPLSKKLSKLKIPHGFVLIFGIMVLAWIMTYLLPSGSFQREIMEIDGVKRSLLVPGTFQLTEATPAGVMDFITAFYKGLIAASDVVFLIFFAYSCFHIVIQTGALDSFIHLLLRKVQGKEWIFIVLFSYLFSLGGSMMGMLSEFYGFIPIFVSLAIAMRYDSLVGFAVVNMSSHIGFAAGTTNPFNVGVAKGISELPFYSGLEFRIGVWFFLTTLSTLYILWYAYRVKKNPEKSIMAGIESESVGNEFSSVESKPITLENTLVLLTVLGCLSTLVYGTLNWKWGMTEIVGLFTAMAVISGVICRWTPDRLAIEFIDGCKAIVYGALITGMARGILIILQKGNIVDTIMYYFSGALDGLSPWFGVQAMLVIQSFANFIIPSGSGQAATTMPIMAGMSDLLGVSREVAVLAFQFGDGFSNLLWPTSGIVVTCALAKIPLERWLKFFMPFFVILVVSAVGILSLAMYLGI